MRRSLVAALFGGLGSLSFAPIQWWPMIWLALAGFFLAIHGTTTARALQGGLFGLGFFLPLLHWSGTYVGAFPWIALAIVQAAFFVPFAIALPWLRRRNQPLTATLALAAMWVLIEAIRARVPWGGFGWGRVAFSQVDMPLAPLVSIGGAALLTFAVVLIVALAIERRYLATGLALAAFLVLSAASPVLSSTVQTGSLKVAGVQGNVPRLGLDFNAQRKAVLDNHLALTKTLTPGAFDLVVWPENASDIDPLSDPEVRREIDDVVDRIEAPVIVGAVIRRDGRLLNAAIAWYPESGASATYIKRRLAPFGEFMPLRPIAEALVPEAKRVIDFSPGTEATLFSVESVTIGTLICFEVLYDDLGRDLTRAGASLLLAQTNSATFGTSPESAQQLQMTRLRALEHGRAIASVSTSGISAMIDERGRVLARSDFFAPTVLTADLPTFSGLTLSDRIDGWSEVALITLPFMLWWWRRR